MLTATAVVLIYRAIVFQPILESFLVSERDATPVIREDTTNGTAISFKRFRKIVPNGEIKFDVKSELDRAISYHQNGQLRPAERI